ncbi:Alginate O-acetyltransferase complex protein AlgJ (plasmid) [Paraburkholderia dioscoreae]|uniref:Alginate O-acetyltransferase complex protein AlgJ n=2 Tax=Paraburkholderia dioscoreae TaxID=2604047 RepID=A0A5Q4Z2T6_9BURK|nr:Alginate O-acetyltransferase complex protein AlgJ [Paraburkholderia dioscoreae]
MIRKINTIAFVIIILCGGAALLWRLSKAGQLFTHTVTSSSWLDGGVTQALDERVAQAAPPDAHINRVLNGLLFAVTGDPDPQVRSGCPGWLFLTEEVVETPGGERNLLRRVELTRKLQADFEHRGIELVTVAVPDKVEQAAGELCGLTVSRQARGRRAAWQQASEGLALHQVDLHSGWIAPGYWRTDSHWNRAGASFAAQRVAVIARAFAPPGDSSMELQSAVATHARSGDLMRLAGIDRNTPPFAPPVDTDHEVQLVIHRSGSLLDNVAAPVVMLAGSSYSLNSGFIDYLQLGMKQEIAQQSRLGSGFAGSVLELLKHHPERLDGIKLMIWEWPLRSLYQPLTDEENNYLAQP